MLLVTEVLIHFNVERGFNDEFYKLLSEGSEIVLWLDVFGQLCGQSIDFFLNPLEYPR